MALSLTIGTPTPRLPCGVHGEPLKRSSSQRDERTEGVEDKSAAGFCSSEKV